MAFVDVRMPPGWDGVETTARVWEKYPELQAVICTAYSDYSWEDMLRKLGYSDRWVVLKKPFDNIEVMQLVISTISGIKGGAPKALPKTPPAKKDNSVFCCAS